MKNLYARFVLWVIGPAIEAHAERKSRKILDAITANGLPPIRADLFKVIP